MESTNKPSQISVIGAPHPKTWKDYRSGCLMTFGGGHHDDGKLKAFQHGMNTVFNLLESEFPPLEEIEALQTELTASKEDNTKLREWAKSTIYYADDCYDDPIFDNQLKKLDKLLADTSQKEKT